ncbi:MAG: inositol monophosphatase family protein [Actinobacteria bacterium]|nr:inositol monophosphatase family protein [Actinomycetota bacterium]
MTGYEDLLALAMEVAKEAGVLLMERPTTFDVSSKSTAIDIATQMDHASEKLIVESLLKSRPEDGIIGEEGASRPSTSGITWVIDPVDGTVNYLYGVPGWSTSIAAKDSDGTVVGVVHAPSISRTWSAARGAGAQMNGRAIGCNEPVALNRALIGTGFEYDVAERYEQGRIVAALLPQIRDLRRIGSAAVDICHVASGGFDGYFEIGLKEWDAAAGALIATEAGALVTRSPEGLTICAGPTLHPELARALAI